mgnify:CR=1 FL=1
MPGRNDQAAGPGADEMTGTDFPTGPMARRRTRRAAAVRPPATCGCPAPPNFSNLTNADCFVTMGGDGFYSRVDPKDPNTIYANMQNGGMVRFDKRTAERVSIQPQPKRGHPPMR